MRWFRANLSLFSFHKFHPFLKTGKIGKEKKKILQKKSQTIKVSSSQQAP
jgi:hypothetical protein